jgi:Cysteine-rich CPCC
VKIGVPILDNPSERADFVDEGFDYFINVFGAPAPDTLYHCPCCGFPTLTHRAGFAVCPICNWEDDGQDSHDADRVRGGPNGVLSLTQARENCAQFGASELRFVDKVRKATPMEIEHRCTHDH